MSGNINEDRSGLFRSAISFLRDSSVADAPLTKKIEFLQSKGLTQEEIQTALKEAQETDSAPKEVVPVEDHKNTYTYEAVPPPLPRRDWKDYFIMATASVGLCYGIYELTKRYIVPNILPEPKTKLAQDKEEILGQFDKVEKLLSSIEQEQETYRQQEEEKLKELDKTVVDLQTTLDDTSRTRQRIEDEFRMLKLEMTNLQNTIDKFVSSNDNVRELKKVNDELSSLKSLIKNSNLAKASSPAGDDSSNTNGIPGANAVPSASEILSKMKLSKKNEDTKVPAWKKSREETLANGTANTNGGSIPEWQKSAISSGNSGIPDWQKAMEDAETDVSNEGDKTP